MSDFSYVTSQSLSEDFKPGFAPSAQKLVPLLTFAPGYRFVFHRSLPNDNVRLATELLPTRLKANGFEIVKAPATDRDLTYTYAGGPLFVITFRYGQQSGRLFNAVDMVIMGTAAHGSWSPDDYVLELQP